MDAAAGENGLAVSSALARQKQRSSARLRMCRRPRNDVTAHRMR